jgi:hypothetical protein
VRKTIGELRGGEADELERVLSCIHCIGHLAQHRYKRDVAKHSPMGQKSAVLLDVPNSPAQQYSRLSANISVADSYLSTLWLDQPVEAA